MNNKEKIYKITCIILIIDQLVKLLINYNMKLYSSITVIPNFFYIFYVKNTGAAFSILENNTLLLSIISVIVILLLNSYIKKEKNLNKLSCISLGLVMGGIFGNLIDRIMHNGVIDYLSFRFFNYDFPVFNIADIGITIGSILLLLSLIVEKKHDNKTKGVNNE